MGLSSADMVRTIFRKRKPLRDLLEEQREEPSTWESKTPAVEAPLSAGHREMHGAIEVCLQNVSSQAGLLQLRLERRPGTGGRRADPAASERGSPAGCGGRWSPKGQGGPVPEAG